MRKRNFRPRDRRHEKSEPPDFWSRLLGPPGEDNEFLEKTGCPACEGTSARILGRLGPTLRRQCRACGLIFISPRLSAAVRQELLRREPAPLTSERNIGLRHEMAERLEQMHREMLPLDGIAKGSASLLEVGCRWGHFLQLCRPHYRTVEGLEWSKERAAFATERFDLNVSATDILRDPWPQRYHVIAAWDVLERETHPGEFLRWVHAHLLPGGQLALSTPNHDSICRQFLRSHWRYFDPSRHLCYFTPATLRALLNEVGFRDISIRTAGLSSLGDRLNRHNQIDRSQDARGQWLESLRAREEKSAHRMEHASIHDSLYKRARRALAQPMERLITAPGWGDVMRVYARKP